MPHREKQTFYLYGRGYHLDSLGLGHLLLSDYANPTHVPHCRIPALTDSELAEWTTTTENSGTLTEARGWNFKAETDVCEIGKVGGGKTSERSKVLIAEEGQRVEIYPDKVREFFQTKILPAKGVKESLKMWMSVSRTRYVLAQVGVRRAPRVWYLTGLIRLSGVTAATVVKKNHSATFGISSELVAAFSGVPIGESVDWGKDFKATFDGFSSKSMVWAAQYQLVDSTPVLRVEADEAIPINYVELHPDYTYAPGTVLAGDEEVDNAFELDIIAKFAPDAIEEEANDESYWRVYQEAKATTDKYI